MHRTFLIIIFLSGFLTASAQKKIAFLQMKAGMSFPLGDFGNSGQGNTMGYAQRGNSLSVDGGYYIVNKAGVLLSYASAKYPFDDAQLGFDYGISATVGDYQTQFFGIGLFYEYDFKKPFSIMARFCVGQHKATFPEQYYEDGEDALDVPSNTQKAIAVPVAFDFKYFIISNLGLVVSFQYQAANHVHSWGVGGYYPVAASWNLSYKTFDLDFGVVFRF